MKVMALVFLIIASGKEVVKGSLVGSRPGTVGVGTCTDLEILAQTGYHGSSRTLSGGMSSSLKSSCWEAQQGSVGGTPGQWDWRRASHPTTAQSLRCCGCLWWNRACPRMSQNPGGSSPDWESCSGEVGLINIAIYIRRCSQHSAAGVITKEGEKQFHCKPLTAAVPGWTQAHPCPRGCSFQVPSHCLARACAAGIHAGQADANI